jgi:hypothetical protein
LRASEEAERAAVDAEAEEVEAEEAEGLRS